MWGTALRWLVLGIFALWLARSGAGGCSSTLPRTGTSAIPFEVPGTDPAGRSVHRLDSYAGRPLVILFFATWCGACQREIPEVQRAVDRDPSLQVLLVSEEDPRVLGAWLSRRQLRLPAAGNAGAVLQAYGVRVLPSAVVVGGDGRVRYSGEGASAVHRALREAVRAASGREEAGPRGEDGGLGDPEGGGNVPRSTCRGNPILC